MLNKGCVEFIGDTETAIDKYTKDTDYLNREDFTNFFKPTNSLGWVESIESKTANGKFEFDLDRYDFIARLNILEIIPELFLGITIENSNGQIIMISSTDEVVPDPLVNITGSFELSFSFPGRILKPGKYYVGFSLRTKSDSPFHKVEKAIYFEIIDSKTERGIRNRYRSGALVAPIFEYSIT